MQKHAGTDEPALENRVHILEQELTKLANQLHGMRKLFFKDRKRPRQRHSEVESSISSEWLRQLPR